MKITYLSLLASVSIVGVGQAESYNLKIARPEKVGNKAEISAKGLDQMSQKFTVGGEVVKEGGVYESASFEAVAEVLAVNDKGKSTKVKYIVKSLQYTADKEVAPKEILADGREVIAVRKVKGKSFTIDGKEAGEDLARALKLVIPQGDETNTLDEDAMFNTKVPRALGDEWDAGIDEMMKSMGADMPLQFDRNASAGKIKLERVEKVNGVECCILTGFITLVPSGMRGLPEGTDFTGSSIRTDLTCPVPMNSATPELGGKLVSNLTIKAEIKTPNGGKGHLDMTSTMSREESAKPIK